MFKLMAYTVHHTSVTWMDEDGYKIEFNHSLCLVKIKSMKTNKTATNTCEHQLYMGPPFEGHQLFVDKDII